MNKPLAASLEMVPVADPLSLFTDHQWYYHQARQTVYFAAASPDPIDTDGLVDLAERLIDMVPQIGAFHVASTGRVLDRRTLEAVVSVESVEDLSAWPDAWEMSGTDLFARTDLPMLRMRAVTRRDGPEADGRRSIIMVLSNHALLEGADSALLTQSQPAGHHALNPCAHHVARWRQIANSLIALLLGPLQLLVAQVIAPRVVDKTCRSLVLRRDRLRRVANRLGLSQRALLFALVCHALNDGGSGYSRRAIRAVFTKIEGRNNSASKSAYFRHWMSEARFRVHRDFASFARTVEAELARVDRRDVHAQQGLFDAIFGFHRVFKRLLPVFYPEHIFRFTGFHHLTLSITPPHRLQGALTESLMEPVHAGSFHPGLDTCVFVPGRRDVTLNFAVSARHLCRISAIETLLASLEA